MPALKLFFWVTLISFLGTLPFSALNITAMQLSMQEGIRSAMYFSVGTIVTEMIYVRIALYGVHWLNKKQVFLYLEWLSFIVILLVAFGSLHAAAKHDEAQNIVIHNHVNRFALGLFMSAVTPMHIPFWFGWSTVLYTKKILQPVASHYRLYILGAACGTFTANCIFIFGGKYIFARLNANQNTLNWILGIVFLLTALIQLVKIINNRRKMTDDR